MRPTDRTARAIALSLVVTLAACAGAAPNPSSTQAPSPWTPPKKPAATTASTAEPQPESKAKAESTAPSTTAPVPPAGAATTPASSSPAQASTAVEPVVARVAGRPILVSELLTQWLYLDPLQVKEQIDNLVLGRLFLAEGLRLSVLIDADRVSQAYDQAVKALEDQIARKRPGVTLDRYVDRVLSLDPIRYRERLRDDARRQLLGERVMRAWLLSTEHAEIHVIVANTEEDMKAVQSDLALGTPFEEVAKKRSADAVSGKEGGRMTPIVKGDTALGRLAFETKEGTVGGPKYDTGAWLFVRVDRRPTPLSGDWSRIGPQVEKSLVERPIDGLEVKQWQSAMLERYDVDEKPFLGLVGQPTR